jgi:hypothetical protein
VSTLNASPEFEGLAFHDRFEALLLSLRQIGQELGHSQVVGLPSQSCFSFEDWSTASARFMAR